ncbi:hypothetical protein MHYP_G00314610 [Metynnis hypsauchen]
MKLTVLLERSNYNVLAHPSEDKSKSASASIMVTDVQLAIFANVLGVSLFLLVVLYHYVAVNNPKKLE